MVTNRKRHPYTSTFLNEYSATVPSCLLKQFRVFAKCNNKYDSDSLIRDSKVLL